MSKKDPVFVCPSCDSDDVIVRAVTSYKVNGGDFYCHSVKTHDSNAQVTCLDCDWDGQLDELKEQP